MVNERKEKILQRIREAVTALRGHTAEGRTIPADVLAPVQVFREDHLRTRKEIGKSAAWLGTSTIHKAFHVWLTESGLGVFRLDYCYVRFGRALGQVLGMRSERRRVKRRQVRGFPVMGVHEQGDNFFEVLYE